MDRHRRHGSAAALAAALFGFLSAAGIAAFGLLAIPFADALRYLNNRWSAPPVGGLPWPGIAVIAFCSIAAYVLGNAVRAFVRWATGWREAPPPGTLGEEPRLTTDTRPPALFVAGGVLSGAGVVALLASIAALAFSVFSGGR